MKLLKSFPKKLYKYNKTRSISRFENPSFGSVTTTSPSPCSDGLSTPTSLLPVYTEVVQAFHIVDRDVDGKLSREEMEAILAQFGPDPPSEEEMIQLLNKVTASDGELRDAFDFFDTDHDGKMTAEELFKVFKSIGDSRCTLDDCRRMIREVDKNGDGFVCFEDFSRMMDQQR